MSYYIHLEDFKTLKSRKKRRETWQKFIGITKKQADEINKKEIERIRRIWGVEVIQGDDPERGLKNR